MTVIAYISGLAMFCGAIYLLKSALFLPGVILLGCSFIVCGGAETIPSPTKQKYKLKEHHIEEIKSEARKDALIRELAFLKNEKTEELVSLVDELTFEDSLIVVKCIETKYPNITIGRGIEL